VQDDDHDDHAINEPALWTYAAWGVLIAMALFATVGFLMLSISASGVSVGARLGTSIYIGFWGGPVFGMAGAVGFQDLMRSRRAKQATVS